MFALFRESLAGRAKAFDFLIALGTHQPMDDAALSVHLGVPVKDGVAGASRIFNHAWEKPQTFAHIGTIPAIARPGSHVDGARGLAAGARMSMRRVTR